MTGNSTLNIVISLIFVYLIYSLLASALQEAFANLFQSRARMLYSGIRSMLSEKDVSKSGLEKLICALLTPLSYLFEVLSRFLEVRTPGTLYEKFYAHPIIKNYGQNMIFQKPSYLSSKNFAEVLIDCLKDLDQGSKAVKAEIGLIRMAIEENTAPKKLAIPVETASILRYHLNESGGDLNVFSYRLESWYNDAMDRVSGWYKRSTQMLLLAIGLFIAAGFNIDTIAITEQLAKDDILSEKLADMATAVSINAKDATDEQKQEKFLEEIKLQKQKVNQSLGLGWDKLLKRKDQGISAYIRVIWQHTDLRKFIGFLLTAIAISLGAPFWFDLLNKFVNLRSTGKAINSANSNATDNQGIDG